MRIGWIQMAKKSKQIGFNETEKSADYWLFKASKVIRVYFE